MEGYFFLLHETLAFFFFHGLQCSRSTSSYPHLNSEAVNTQDLEITSSNNSLQSFNDIDISESVNEIDLLIFQKMDKKKKSPNNKNELDMKVTKDNTTDTTGPVTIYNSNMLGISISVEEPTESNQNGSSAKIEKQKSTTSVRNFIKPFKRIASATRLTSFDVEKNAESVALVEPCTSDKNLLTTPGRQYKNTPKQQRYVPSRRQLFQGRAYMFLEHPVGWICFAYHMAV